MAQGRIPYDLYPGSNTKANEARVLDIVSRGVLDPTQDGLPVSPNDPNGAILSLLRNISNDQDIAILLQTLGLNFQGFNFALTAGVITQIIQPAKFPRGYIIINPAEISGFSSTVTFLASAARAPGTYTSTAFNVSGIDRVAIWLDVTANALPHTLTVNAQTQDPLTGNWATSQPDIFTGSNAVGTYYALVGQLGVDRNIRLQAVVGAGAGTATFSLSGLLKGGTATPTGSTIYLGAANVNTTIGYPLLPGQRETWYLRDSVPLFCISPTEPVVLKVFQLQ